MTLASLPLPVRVQARPSDLRADLERLHDDCMGWALACCDYDRPEAEDVLQATYLKVLDGRAGFGGTSSFRTWLFGVIRRTASEERRRRAVRRFFVGRRLDEIPLPDPAPGADAALDQDEDASRLRRALRALPSRQQQVLHLVFYQGLTVEEAATVMHVSAGSARTHYARGKARLRALLGMEDTP